MRIYWKPDLISSGLKIGQPSGPWFVLNATLHLFSAPHAYLLPNRNGHVSARLPLLPGQVNQKRPNSSSRSANCPRDQKSVLPDPAVTAQTPVSSLFLSQVAELVPKHTPTNAATQRTCLRTLA